jgi:bifunctional non-homologous end joining protein LigD
MEIERWLLDARVVDFLAAGLPGEKRLARTECEGVLSATAVQKLPEGDAWIYEVKWGGYRVEAIKHQEIQLFSRKARNLTSNFPGVRQAVTTIKAEALKFEVAVSAVTGDTAPPRRMKS